MRLTAELPMAEGEIHQIDYDKQQRIAVIHVEQRDGTGFQIRFTYPESTPWDITPHPNPVVILRPQQRPEVSVVRLA